MDERNMNNKPEGVNNMHYNLEWDLKYVYPKDSHTEENMLTYVSEEVKRNSTKQLISFFLTFFIITGMMEMYRTRFANVQIGHSYKDFCKKKHIDCTVVTELGDNAKLFTEKQYRHIKNSSIPSDSGIDSSHKLSTLFLFKSVHNAYKECFGNEQFAHIYQYYFTQLYKNRLQTSIPIDTQTLLSDERVELLFPGTTPEERIKMRNNPIYLSNTLLQQHFRLLKDLIALASILPEDIRLPLESAMDGHTLTRKEQIELVAIIEMYRYSGGMMRSYIPIFMTAHDVFPQNKDKDNVYSKNELLVNETRLYGQLIRTLLQADTHSNHTTG